MATYNGARWLDDQLQSFADQTDVSLGVVVSDDQSTDATLETLQAWRGRLKLTILPRAPRRFGNANRNFMRLVRDASTEGYDYVCFSDQDDIWIPGKLSRAITRIAETGSDAYSSNVTAFWDGGREKVITKSQPQRLFDHIFESAGPGCTFVFSRQAFGHLRDWAIERQAALMDARVHDWSIYAYGREDGWRWLIDDFSGIRYRQHASNEIGANVGLKSALQRLDYILSGRYRLDVISVARLAGHSSEDLDRLRRFTIFDRLILALRARRYRRRALDAITLAASFLLMKDGGPGADP